MNKSRGESANRFSATRSHHMMELAEDYTELIADLIEKTGVARTCEIARNMNISHVTAIKAIKRLQRAGFVETELHKPVILTEKGKELAQLSKQRHALLLKFLLAIGVTQSVAEIDAEGMEHHISEATLEAMDRHLCTLQGAASSSP